MASSLLSSMRIRTKLVGLLAGICLIALASACAAFVWYDRQSYAAAKQRTLEVLVDAVAQSAKGPVAFADKESASYVLQTIEREQSALLAAVYLSDGTLLSTWQRDQSPQEVPGKLSDLDQRWGYIGDQLRLMRPIEQEGQKLGQLYARFSTSDIDERTLHFLSIAAIVLLFAFLAAWAAANMAHGVITKPVTKLVEAVTTLQQSQDFSVRAEKVSGDELGLLTDSFNEMVGAIEARDEELASYRADLERRVEARTRDLDARNVAMRLVLDNVDQGFVTIDRDGTLQSERSQAFDRFFEVPEPGTKIWDHLERQAESFGILLEMGWEAVLDGVLPLDLCIDQLPRRLQTMTDRHFDMDYRPIMNRKELDKALVIFTDVTAAVARERQRAEESETIAIFEGVTKDRAAFMDFFHEAERITTRVLHKQNADVALVMRDLHTLKGNFGVARMHAMARQIHDIESRCLEAVRLPSSADLLALAEAWEGFAKRVHAFVGDTASNVEIASDDYNYLRDQLAQEGTSNALQAFVAKLCYEPTSTRLERLAREGQRLGKRLGIANLAIDIDHGDVTIPPGSGWLWAAVTHLVRNCVDHGLADASNRDRPTLRLATAIEDEFLAIEVSDNGCGISWDAIRDKARGLDLPSETHEDLAAALFADGLSTLDQASEVSGRGFGLAAARAALRDRGGDILVRSAPGEGTSFTVSVPLTQLSDQVRVEAA